MANIAALLKSEISRVARKELRAETQSLKKAVAAYRSDIAALKRRMQSLEQALRRLGKAAHQAEPAAQAGEEAADSASSGTRFSAKGFASQRKRLGLSAADCGLLIGASGLSVYKWESGNARPRAKFLPAIAGFRALGKKEAAARLAALR